MQKKVQVKILKHRFSGLSVWDSESNREGLIRVRETSWEKEEQEKWKELFPIGKVITVVPIKNNDEKLEFSIRLAIRDPWENVFKIYHKGDMVYGIVTNVTNFGAFVNLPHDIVALFPPSLLPSWCKKNILDIFWPGDHIFAKINSINIQEREMTLEWCPFDLSINKKEILTSENDKNDISLNIQEQNGRINFRKSILIIEDNLDYGKVLTAWFKNSGQKTEFAATATNGLTKFSNHYPDIVITDFHLPDKNGIEILQEIRKKSSTTRCFLMTDPVWEDVHKQELDSLLEQGIHVLWKPLPPETLTEILLDKWVNPNISGPSHETQIFSNPKITELISDKEETSFDNTLKEMIFNCRKDTGFENIIIFCLLPNQRSIEIYAANGNAIQSQIPINQLIYSPVRDVAEDNDFIVIEDLDQKSEEGRFAYLVEAFPFSACLGIKIPSPSEENLALFLFSKSPREIYEDEINLAKSTALLISCLLEKKWFSEQAIILQKFTLLGMMSSSLIHEINHHLSPLLLEVDDITSDISDKLKDKNIWMTTTKDFNEIFNEGAHQLKKRVSRIEKTTRMFGRILTNKKGEFVFLDEIVNEAIYLVNCFWEDKRVSINLEVDEGLKVVRTQASFLEQVLINLLLNAIEHTTPIHPKDGQIRIQISVLDFSENNSSINTQKQNSPTIRVMIEDNGCGIHWRDWDKVFTAGFTTRPGGNGLGLYISKNIMKELNGKIYIKESCILNGTKFVLEFPRNI